MKMPNNSRPVLKTSESRKGFAEFNIVQDSPGQVTDTGTDYTLIYFQGMPDFSGCISGSRFVMNQS